MFVYWCIQFIVLQLQAVAIIVLLLLQGTWAERLLKVMYYVTLNHGRRFPEQIGMLWAALAGSRQVAASRGEYST